MVVVEGGSGSLSDGNIVVSGGNGYGCDCDGNGCNGVGGDGGSDDW